MIVRAKTKRRLIILLCCVLGISAGISALVLLRMHQTRKQLEAARVEGLAAFARGDYQAVIEKLDEYVNRAKKPDARAIHALAQAYRLRSTNPTAGDLTCAMKGYMMYLDKYPGETAVRRDLVDVLYRLNHHPEAMEQASRVLADPKFKDDYDMLRIKAKILAGSQQRPADAVELAERCNALRPLDVEMQEMTLRLYADPRVKQMSKILAKVCDLLDRNPNEPAALALAAMGLDVLGDELSPEQRQDAAALIYDATHHGEATPLEGLQYSRRRAVEVLAHKAAALTINDPMVVLILKHLFEERLSDINASIALMEKALATQQKPEYEKAIRRALVTRLWESGRYQDVVANVDKLQPTGADPAEVDLLVYKATALVALKQPEPAKEIAAQLAAREQSKYAAQWGIILRDGILAEKPQWPKTIAAARQLIDSEDELRWRCPLARYYLGDAYASIGELQLAETALEGAITANRLWGQAYVRMSQVCMARGDVRGAVLFAEAGRKLPPLDVTLVNAAAIKGQVQSSRLKGTDPYRDLAADDPLRKALDTTSSHLEEAHRKQPGNEQTTPAYVLLLAQQGQGDKAKQILQQALATTRPAVPTLDALSRISRDFKLGCEAKCEAMIAQEGGLTPQAALIRALERYQKDKSRAQADELFTNAQKNSRDGSALAWRSCWAQYLSAVGDAKAGEAWMALADDPAARDDLEIQRAALAASAVQSDLAFLNRTVDRIEQLTGDQAITWRLAKAQLLLREKNPDYAQAGKLLEEVTGLVPGQSDAQLLLAIVAERRGDSRLAIERLSKLAEGSANAAAIRLELARLHIARNEMPLALQQMERVTREQLTVPQVLQLIELHASAGNPLKAMELSKSLLANQPQNVEAHKAFVLNLLRLGRIDEAMAALKEVPQAENDPLSRLRKCAATIAAIKQWPGTADLAVALIQSPEQADGAEKALAIVAEGNAQKESAIQTVDKLRALSDSTPDFVTLHVILTAQYRAMGKFKDAAEMAIRASEQLPRSPRLAEATAAALIEADRFADAETWLGKVAALIPGNSIDDQLRLADAWRALGYRTKRAEHYDKAIAILSRVVSENPTRATLVAQRGLAYEAAGRLNEAKADYRKALEMDDKIAPAMNNLALLLAADPEKKQPADFDEALALATRAVQLTAKAAEASPKNERLREMLANFHDTLATIQAKAGDHKAAIASLKSAVQLQQANTGWKMRLAEVCIEAGEFTEAESALGAIAPDQLKATEKAKYDQLRAKAKASAASASR